jgi:Domain of unknown function (DUF4340)
MNNRGFYLVAAIFLAAVGLYYFFDVRKPPPSTATSPRPGPLVNIDAATVSEIDIKANAKVLMVSRNGAEWRYSVCPAAQPGCPSQPASSTRSVQLLQAILQLSPSKTIFGAPEGLPAYGLASASGGEIDLKTPSGRTVSVLVGANAPDGVSVYVRLADSNDVQAVPLASIQTPILGAIDAPPVPLPTPSPSAAPGTPASPSAGPIGPGAPSP